MYVTEITAGLQTEPYKRVIVTGGKATSMEEGEDTSRSHLLSKTKVQGIAWVEDASPADPTYRYEDSSLHTAEMAQNVAEGIMEEFQRQRASGEITVVGDPAIRVFDVVNMPDFMGSGDVQYNRLRGHPQGLQQGRLCDYHRRRRPG